MTLPTMSAEQLGLTFGGTLLLWKGEALSLCVHNERLFLDRNLYLRVQTLFSTQNCWNCSVLDLCRKPSLFFYLFVCLYLSTW